ncbi:MAG: TlpA family protein disulfide reductase [Deltaproteobacteria bacterium]|nr:MAG: TlpA family protein disulfide reductase [Deltaproteobacteria bacterium]
MSGRALKPNWFILGLGIGAVLLFAGVMVIGFTQDPRALDTRVMVGATAPDFVLQDLDGAEVELASLKGRPVVINFWSTWCQPCKVEHPLLQRAPALYPDVAFVGVLYQDKPEAARSYLKRAPVDYAQLVDPAGKVAIAYGVTGVPETFFIDPHGRITHKLARALTAEDLAENLEPMLR